MLRTLSFVFIFLLTTNAYAECNFKTGEYIKQLKDPSNIQLIKIKVPKSAKYEKNLLKIFTSRGPRIYSEQRKKFKANISVNYSFGTCKFKGIVRQNGDYKDHIVIRRGNLHRSLHVKLKTGNIVSAIEFKLLVPKTRNSENEILATLILKHLGIISPETFGVNVDVNGKTSLMLFQEDSRKELLEKNQRRENAIFEGSEDLIWGFDSFEDFRLEQLSLSRMINRNWFKKGSSSQAISLSAYSQLQSAYLDYGTQMNGDAGFIISPNQNQSPEFIEYIFALLPMNGRHALRPHNRKFYFNSITSKFEPIYYDGNTNFRKITDDQLSVANEILKKKLKFDIDPVFIKKIYKVLKSQELKEEFIKYAEPLNKTEISKSVLDNFYDKAIINYMSNMKLLDIKKSNVFDKENDFNFNKTSMQKYLKTIKSLSDDNLFSQKIIRKLEQSKDGYVATFQSGFQKNLSTQDVSSVIGRNRLDGQRTIFLGKHIKNKKIKPTVTKQTYFAKKITTTAGVEVMVSETDKVMTFKQTNQDDWVLIQSGDLTGWKILFYGVEKEINSKLLTNQRFNEHGLTGCLNFYESKFKDTSIEVVGGVCEDSVNIIASKGIIDSILVKDAFADALDIDFSEINIFKINVQNAGNDCLDFSGGNYQINMSNLINCADKGISVGEGSTLFVKTIKLTDMNIGVSSKDLSNVEILDAQIINSTVCFEVKQKKQEFGGAFLLVGKLECDGAIEVDEKSTYKEGLF